MVTISTLGRLSGALGDFLSPPRLLSIALTLEGLGMALLLVATTTVRATVAVSMIGLGFGMAYISQAATFARFFGRAAFATPVVHRPADGKAQVIFASTSHGLTCLDAASGELRWEVDDLFEQRCVATPVLAQGAAGKVVVAFAGQGGGGTEGVAIALPRGDSNARVAYRLRRSLPYVPSPVAADGHLFLFNDGGVVSCLDATTGADVWRERVDGEFFGSPVVADGRLFAMTREGELVVLAASNEFRELARVDLDEPTFATPALADGVLYARTEHHVVAFGSR